MKSEKKGTKVPLKGTKVPFEPPLKRNSFYIILKKI